MARWSVAATSPSSAAPAPSKPRDQAVKSAVVARDAGVDILRAFVDKSRTSPYDYRGLEIGRGLEIVKAMKAATGLPVVGELIDLRHLDAFLEAGIDVIQIGARSAQYSPLLEELSRIQTPRRAQARLRQRHERVALRRRLHHVRPRPRGSPHRRRQPERDPLLPRHPLVRVRDPLRRRHLDDSAGAKQVAPAPHRRPLPQLRRPRPRRARLLRFRRSRRERPRVRHPLQPRGSTLRRPSGRARGKRAASFPVPVRYMPSLGMASRAAFPPPSRNSRSHPRCS